MAYIQKEGDISLFRNDKKQPGSNQPDMRGTMVWHGEKIKISVWSKGEGDRRFLAGKCEPDTSDPGAYNPAPLPPSDPIKSEPEDTSDSLPF